MAASLHPVARDRHEHKTWQGPQGYAHFRTETVAPVSAAELWSAVRALPMGFVPVDGSQTLVALLGLVPGENLFVAPDGRWLGSYVPAVLRAYPFRLGQTGEADQFALVVDEASGLIGDKAVGEAGTPFFDDEGNPAEGTRKVLDFLVKVHRSQQAANRAVAALADKELIEPWPLKAEKDGEVKNVAGVGRIAEAKLADLTGDDLVELRDNGALALAYMQLASMANLAQIGALAKVHKHFAESQSKRMEIPPGSFIDEADDEMKIDWDAILGDE